MECFAKILPPHFFRLAMWRRLSEQVWPPLRRRKLLSARQTCWLCLKCTRAAGSSEWKHWVSSIWTETFVSHNWKKQVWRKNWLDIPETIHCLQDSWSSNFSMAKLSASTNNLRLFAEKKKKKIWKSNWKHSCPWQFFFFFFFLSDAETKASVISSYLSWKLRHFVAFFCLLHFCFMHRFLQWQGSQRDRSRNKHLYNQFALPIQELPPIKIPTLPWSVGTLECI